MSRNEWMVVVCACAWMGCEPEMSGPPGMGDFAPPSGDSGEPPSGRARPAEDCGELGEVPAHDGPPAHGEVPADDIPLDCHPDALVRLGLYREETCAGDPVLVIELDTSLSCSMWSRQTGDGTRDNSASRFQCYRDMLCYTQFTTSGECGGDLVADKVATSDCMKDPTPGIWIKILEGTEDCPEAPEGFECPLSEIREGNKALHAACE